MSAEIKIEASPWFRGNLPALAGIVLLGVVLYAHTLNVPWYMDDVPAIVENRTVHSLQEAIGDLFSGRGVANLTFALNYAFGGTDVVGYHVVNIAIHLATSCLVFFLLTRVFRDRLLLAFGGALIFVAHPLQTQAVTYIVQRMTSLAALFFFLAIYLYVRARESSKQEPTRQWGFYGGALLCGALAVLIKQNSAVLPLAIVLFDRYFLCGEERMPWKRLLWYVAPFAVVPGVLAFKSLVMPMLTGGGIAEVGGMPDLVHLRHSSPLNYLVTQFSVIWIYIRLLFVPYGQALDYDVPIVATLWVWRNWIGFLGIAVLLAAASFLRKRSPLVSAGIFWFFLCLAVESTIIPLDPVFEHRLYVPMFGFILIVMAGIQRLPGRTALVGGMLMLTAISVLTWQRNDLWIDPIAFYEDNLRRAPGSERVHLDLGNAYRRQGLLDEALSLYKRALEINSDYVLIHTNLSMVYTEQKRYQDAVDILLDGLSRNPSHFRLHNNLGVLYNYMGRYDEAASALYKGLRLEPNNGMLHLNLALALDRLNRVDEAITHYRRSISLNYSNPSAHFNLGLALHRRGGLREALQAFLAASRLNPGHAGALYNAAMIHISLGDPTSARTLAEQLQQINPGMAQEIFHRILRENAGS